MTTIMVDGVGSDVPAILARFGRSHPVGGYLWQPGTFGYIPWTKAQLDQFPAGHILTATRGGFPQDAAHAREIDRETGDAGDEDVAPWLIHRHDAGFSDGQVYCDLSSLPGVLGAIDDAGLSGAPWWRLRVAWWWGRPAAPTLGEVMGAIMGELEAAHIRSGLVIPAPAAGRVWGCQWLPGGTYDLTAVYGAPDFTRPR